MAEKEIVEQGHEGDAVAGRGQRTELEDWWLWRFGQRQAHSSKRKRKVEGDRFMERRTRFPCAQPLVFPVAITI